MTDDATRTHTMDLAPPGGAAARALRLTPAGGAETIHAARRVLVGRGEGVDLRVDDPTVSQFHVELVATSAGVLVTDLGSRNGTRVATAAGEVALRAGWVPFGSVLLLGGARVTLGDGGPLAAERSGATSFGDMVGTSPVMREVYALLERLARTELAVLVEGPSGSGKETAARGLHQAGPRAGGPFVVLDCASIPPALADDALAGIVEAANGGTLFLDEIGDLPLDLQPKVLRALAEAARTHVRVVGAARKDLRTMVNAGALREDLYYRVAQARVRVPPLSERHEDVKPLVQHFLSKLPWDVKAARAIEPDALDAIAARTFPGNVRELRAVVERAAMVAEGAAITMDDLAFERMLAGERSRGAASIDGPLAPFKEAKRTLIDEFEKAYLARLLARAGTNVSRAAALAGIERQSLRDLLKRHGLRGDD